MATAYGSRQILHQAVEAVVGEVTTMKPETLRGPRTIMPTRYFFITVFVVAILVVIVVGIATGSIAGDTGRAAIPAVDSPAAQVEHADLEVEADLASSTTIEPALTKVTPPQDGPSLLEDHCAGCHSIKSFERSKNSRTEWEMALIRMNRLGVHLSETERVVLLDYLAAADRP